MRSVDSLNPGPSHEFGCCEAFDQRAVENMSPDIHCSKFRPLRTIEVQASARPGHCITDAAYLIVHCHEVQERCSRRYVQVPDQIAVRNNHRHVQSIVPTHILATARLLRFNGGCIPNFVVVLGRIEVLAMLQSILDHHVIVLEFQILHGTDAPLVTEWERGLHTDVPHFLAVSGNSR